MVPQGAPMDFLPFIAADVDRLAEVGRTTIDLEVPTCPGWTVGRLIGHLGRVQQWVAAMVNERSLDGTVQADLPDAPRGPEVVEWFQAGAQRMLQVLAAVDGEDPVFNIFVGGEGPSWLWHRRMAVEAALHRWDGERALGLAQAGDIDVHLAGEGLHEFFDLIFGRAAKGSLPGSLHLHRTDGEGEWVIRLGTAGGTVTMIHDKADCALRGPASDLLLWVWNRIPADDLEQFGDITVAEAWKDAVRA